MILKKKLRNELFLKMHIYIYEENNNIKTIFSPSKKLKQHKFYT